MQRRSVRSAIVALALLVCGACGRESRSGVWKPSLLGTAADFRDVFFVDANRGWIAGGGYDIPGGLIGRTTDGGKTWQFTSGILSSSPTATGVKVHALHFFDAQRGVAVGDGGKVYVTHDGGDLWGEVQGRSGSSQSLLDLEFIDEESGWAVGLDGVLATDDGGEHWKAFAKGKLQGRAIAFIDAYRGWAVGPYATAMATPDGGRSWNAADIPLPKGERIDFWDVFFLDAQNGWICGDEGTLLRSVDGGNTWTVQDLGIDGVRSAPKLERIARGDKVDVIDAGDRTPGLTLAAIRFADSRNGWIVGFFANYGRSWILRTRDGGKTWSIEADIEGEELRALHLLDATRAWAIGARTRPGAQAIYVRDAAAK